jgi:AcrR family transcriptional regulator
VSSLRERQKEQRREAILAAAVELFEQLGFTATTVEQIAARAGVSAPTVFNYFGSKQDILFALAVRADSQGLEEAIEQLPAMDSMVDAMCHLNSRVVKRELEALPAAVWREICGPYGNVSEGYKEVNRRLIRETAKQLRQSQKRGRINDKFEPEFVAEFLNDYCSLMFAKLVHQDPPDLAAHDKQVRQAFELIFNGLHP